MDTNVILTRCPRCQLSLEIPPEFDNVICCGCSTSYWVLRHGSALSLSEIWPANEDTQRARNSAVDRRLAEIEELIEESESESEILRSKEQSAPLQLGCAFFGLFMMIILLIALFMFLGNAYIGSWAFYAAIAGVVMLGLARIRRKLIGSAQREKLRRDRILIEDRLAQLQTERRRLRILGDSLPDQAHEEGRPDS